MSDQNSENETGASGDESRHMPQRFERSLDFWVSGKEDYPPAIRGVMAEIHDLPENVQHVLQRIAKDPRYPGLALQRLLWFEDKNDKLDEACVEARAAFRPYAVNADGLVSTNPATNPLLGQPTRHRLVVSDQFASENYEQPDDGRLLVDGDEESSGKIIGEKAWQRKIVQTIKPWAIRKDGRVEHARPKDDLMLTLNELFSRTRHGWLVVDLFKLRERRGTILTYARTFEYQRKGSQAFEFKVELFGVAKELKRFEPVLSNLGCLYLEVDEQGEVYLTKASVYRDNVAATSETPSSSERSAIPLEVKVELRSKKPSQLTVVKSGEFYESQLKPLIELGQKSSHKIDLRPLTGDQASRFVVQVELDAPLLVATSGDAVIFELNDMLNRFVAKNLVEVRTTGESN